MADKQGNLNGAFYGPSIPPPQQSKPNYRHSRSRSCGCCLFSVLWKILLVLIVLLVIAGFIFWLVVRPTKIKLHVTEASLTQFNLTSNTLHYNLALNATMRNPNRKLGVYNDRIEAKAFFEGARFDSKVFTDLGLLKKKSSKDLSVAFEGQRLLALDADEINDFNEQKTAGVFDIDVKFYLRNRLRLGDFIGGKFKPKIKCDLKVPLITNGVSSGTFQKTKCDVDFF
ncbi:NDR1/HIN1-like protein 10 [Ziziphus jujuba]|uniref:NDR1/HIN1-like protein 10 n=2 Tax=Ziziphus jujuba TaxID=326968 RepID=A0A6P4AQR0_ZIZJJ|nr:NDR1/HIN1-like protein 10 [Ziziphus jujuba]KAH7512240.1 hypothetical protein FEM48_Zijuj12G0069400 [Ziziphus jujuba var. spinosa]